MDVCSVWDKSAILRDVIKGKFYIPSSASAGMRQNDTNNEHEQSG
jgi:hypothetical protein